MLFPVDVMKCRSGLGPEQMRIGAQLNSQSQAETFLDHKTLNTKPSTLNHKPKTLNP